MSPAAETGRTVLHHARAFGLAAAVAAVLLESVAPADAQSSPTGVRTYAVPGAGSLALHVPEGWRDSVEAFQGTPMRSITFRPPSGDDFAIKITAGDTPGGQSDFNSPARMRRLVELEGQQLLATAVEQTLTVETLAGPRVSGYHYTLSDKSSVGQPPRPDDYPYLTRGMAATGTLLVVFSIFTRDKNSPARQAALAMLAAARQSAGPAAGSPATGGQRASLSLPGYRWRVGVDLPGFAITGPLATPEQPGKTRLTGENRSTGMIISMMLEKVAAPGDAAGCRSLYAAALMQSPLMKGVEVSASEFGRLALIAYVISEVRGMPVNQRHLNAFLSQDDTCLDLHLSKAQFKPGDERLFEAVVKSLAVERP